MMQEPGLAEIDAQIAGRFRLLRFQSALEGRFENDGAEDRCRKLMAVNLIGLCVYHAFLVSDFVIINDAFGFDLVLHFGIMTPAVLFVNSVIDRCPRPRIREGSVVVAALVLALTIMAAVLSSRMPVRDLVQFDTILVVLFVTSVQRLRFWYCVVNSGAMLAIYSFGLYELHLDPDRSAALLSTFVGVLLFSMVSCYNLEHEMRMGYLLRWRDRLRNRELEAVTLLDALTTIGNRRAMEAELQEIHDAAMAGSLTATAILLLDIDHFKAFNDTNGHQAGDACLKRVALLAAGALSTRGTAYRYGGEEFAAILRGATTDEALRWAEAIRRAVVDASIPKHPGADAVVTVSIGVSVGEVGRDTTAAALIEAADQALYAAKRSGRNRVRSSVPGSAGPADDREPLLLSIAS